MWVIEGFIPAGSTGKTRAVYWENETAKQGKKGSGGGPLLFNKEDLNCTALGVYSNKPLSPRSGGFWQTPPAPGRNIYPKGRKQLPFFYVSRIPGGIHHDPPPVDVQFVPGVKLCAPAAGILRVTVYNLCRYIHRPGQGSHYEGIVPAYTLAAFYGLAGGTHHVFAFKVCFIVVFYIGSNPAVMACIFIDFGHVRMDELLQEAFMSSWLLST